VLQSALELAVAVDRGCALALEPSIIILEDRLVLLERTNLAKYDQLAQRHSKLMISFTSLPPS